MTSTIKVDTISENTSANGVAVDGVTLKDGALTASGIVKTDDTTNATSTTDGSLQTDGGLSVVLDAVIGDDLFMKSDAAVIHFGADSDVTLTHVADKGLTLSTATGDDSLILQSTLADNNSAPRLKLHRASSSPADNDLLGAITWSFLDDGGNSHEAAYIRATATDVSNGSEDASLEFNVDVAGTNTERLSFNAVEAVFNEDSQDIDFRVESNGNANMFTINAGTDKVGIGDNPDLGLLHVKSADSGASANANADELVIEGNDNSGLTILSGTSGSGNIHFGDSGDNDIGLIRYDHGSNDMLFVAEGSEAMRFDGKVISTGGETAGDVNGGGICLNQGSTDGNILAFKSSDVGHGITDSEETDTYFSIEKRSSDGGITMKTFHDSGDQTFRLEAFAVTENATKGTTGNAPINLQAIKKSGTGGGVFGSNANLFCVANNGNTKFIVDAEGELHSDGGAQSAYDTYEDAHLVRAYDLSHGKGVINSQFDKFISYNHESLAEAGLVGREKDGTPNNFINVTGMSRLHNGAIWQQYEKHQRLTQAMYKLAVKTLGKEEADKLLDEEEIKLLN